jgi:hypothetical protein
MKNRGFPTRTLRSKDRHALPQHGMRKPKKVIDKIWVLQFEDLEGERQRCLVEDEPAAICLFVNSMAQANQTKNISGNAQLYLERYEDLIRHQPLDWFFLGQLPRYCFDFTDCGTIEGGRVWQHRNGEMHFDEKVMTQEHEAIEQQEVERVREEIYGKARDLMRHIEEADTTYSFPGGVAYGVWWRLTRYMTRNTRFDFLSLAQSWASVTNSVTSIERVGDKDTPIPTHPGTYHA